MYTYQREPEEESTRSWTYRSRESDGTGGICFLLSDQYRDNHRFLSSKRKQQDEGVKIANELKMQNILYHQDVAVSFSISLPEVDHDERPHSHEVADDLNQRRHSQLSRDDGTTKTGT